MTNTSFYNNQILSSGKAIATLAGKKDEGRLNVKFEFDPYTVPSDKGNYNILDTDYENFSIVYSRNNYGVFVWILTR